MGMFGEIHEAASLREKIELLEELLDYIGNLPVDESVLKIYNKLNRLRCKFKVELEETGL